MQVSPPTLTASPSPSPPPRGSSGPATTSKVRGQCVSVILCRQVSTMIVLQHFDWLSGNTICCMMRGRIKGTDSTIISMQENTVLYKS